jgi:hypothetical protein
MTKKLFLSLLLCLSLLGTASPALAQVKSGDDTLAQLQQEGWRIVKDGVLQRELVPGEVESFVFGVPGFIWKIQDLQKQLRKLQAELKANPTPELRKAIANHRKAIANSQRALTIARASEESGEEIDLSKVSCTINFSYDATAGKKTDAQGLWSRASASFGANCGGFSGQAYAYAFAKTTVNGAQTTETVTDGPRSGANVSATAYASRNGGDACESYSFGEMVSYSLNPSSYSKSATQSDCSIPAAPTVTVVSNQASTINLYGENCVSITWTTNISNGLSPYNTMMYYNSNSVGARTSYTKTICNGASDYTETITVRANVTDSAGRTGTGSQTITINHHYYYYDPCATVWCPTGGPLQVEPAFINTEVEITNR